jgi:NAD(P)-dependent dehydrogenase (short-subunit alcohol dehydrogenase family)
MRTIVITGASSGIGAAAARRLAADGARVVVVGRDERRTNEVADELDAERHVADFARLSDVHALADRLRALDRLDVLALNAGAVFGERELTEDGFEKTFQVNHLSGFLLTRLLLPLLVASRASVISTSSMAHLGGRLDLANLQLDRGWSSWRAYSNAKLANVLFTRGLHRHHVLDGVHAAAFHPGVVATRFGVRGGATEKAYGSPLGRLVMATPDQGADTLVWLAQRTPPRDWVPGGYYVKRTLRKPNRQALDTGLVDAFWARSARLVEG